VGRVTARTVVALSWSLVTGLVGGWLMLSPWALGERTSGGWPPVVRTEFFSGLGLVALALACLLVVAVQVAAVLRSGPNSASDTAGPSPELESTLVAVAQALTADLMSKGSMPGERSGTQPPDQAAPPAEARSSDGRRDER